MSLSGFIYHMLKAQWFMTVPTQNATFEDQNIIITGANTGLGLAAAKYMVTHKAAKVIIACRSITKGEAAKKQLEAETGRTNVVEVWPLDLASHPSVKEFATRATNELDRLDVVICNAGINTQKLELVDNTEKTIYVNVISTFLLALSLLPKLKSTKEQHPSTTPHLAIVSSDTHYVMTLSKQHKNKDETIFAQLSNKKRAQMLVRYPLSKLLDILLTQQLVAHLPKDYPVIINTMNPGLCYSDLQREAPSILAKATYTLFNARTAEQGIQNYIYGVSGDRNMHGKYISECQEGPLGPGAKGAQSEAVGARLWQELTEMLEKISPGIVSKL
jgi:retinol dehydrogenase-12